MNEKNEKQNSSPLSVQYLGDGLDELKRRYLLLSVNGDKVRPINVDLVAKESAFFATLNAAGAHIFQKATKAQVLKLFEETKADNVCEVVSRLGWHFGQAFVYPGRVIGGSDRQIESALGDLDPQLLAKYRQGGTLESWQKQVLPLCEGNSRLMLAVCWAFASAVAALLGEAQKSGGFQFFGRHETGKTTCAVVAGSVWGLAEGRHTELGFAESWNTTANKIEELMSAHTHVGLILDETTHFEGDFNAVVMRLSEGIGKQRMYQGPPITFEGFFLSTSNPPTWDLVKAAGKRVNEAVLSRICDVPLPTGGHGVFEELHGFAEGSELSKAIKVRSYEHFGTAGPTFIERLVQVLSTDDGRAECLEYLRQRRRAYRLYVARMAKSDSFRVMERPADRFAGVYAAGRLAAKLGILPWKWKDIREAVISCHMDALRDVQPHLTVPPKAPARSVNPVSMLLSYIKHRGDEFVDLDTKPLELAANTFGSAPGYRATFKRRKWFYFTKNQLIEIAGDVENYKALCEGLSSKGLMERGKNSITVQRPVYTGGQGNKNFTRVVAIRRKVLKEVA